MIELLSNVFGAYLYTSLCAIAFCINLRFRFHIFLSSIILIDSLISWSLHTPLLEAARSGDIPISAWYMFCALTELTFLLILTFAHHFKYIPLSLRVLALIYSSLFFIILQSLRLIERTYEISILESSYTPLILLTVAIKAIVIMLPTVGIVLLKIVNTFKYNNLATELLKKIALVAMLNKEAITRSK